jgi:hypothetical protein
VKQLGLPVRDRWKTTLHLSEEAFPLEVAEILPKLIRDTGCGDWEVAPTPLHRKDCTIFFLRSRSYRISKAVLKIFRENRVEKNHAKKLHRMGQRYHAAATTQFTVPEPVTLLEEKNAMVMEYIDAPSCSSLLMKEIHSKRRKRRMIRQAAAWLAWFHAQSGVTLEPFDATSFVSKIRKTYEDLHVGRPKGASRHEFLAKCIASAETVASEMSNVPIPHAAIHADFTPYNLFIQGDRIIGYDFLPNRRCPVAHDIGRFLIHLDVYQLVPTRAAEQSKYGCRKNDLEDFIEAYGWESRVLEDIPWLKLHFLSVLRRITTLTRIRASGRRKLNPFPLVELAYLRRNARNMLESLG